MKSALRRCARGRSLIAAIAILLVLAVAGGAFAWYKFFREEPQP